MYRLKTSDGTPNPATWPMCRGPLAYGQATAERMRDMPLILLTAAGRSFREPVAGRRCRTKLRRYFDHDHRTRTHLSGLSATRDDAQPLCRNPGGRLCEGRGRARSAPGLPGVAVEP